MSSFANMKKNASEDFSRLQKELEKQGGGKRESYDDPRFWSLERDKTGNGSAVIRFLPASEGESEPIVRIYSHHFQGKGGWLIENCPTTIQGQKCPICEANNELWEESHGDDSHPSRKIARDRKRKVNYISNIYVVSDPSNRENEGKVFLFKYGKMIFDKIQAVTNPSDPDDPKFNPFNLWTGANFKLKAFIDSGYVTYKDSRFTTQAPLNEDDAKMEKIWKTQHSLREFVDPKMFKSYEELQTKLDKVLKNSNASPKAESAKPNDFRSKMNVDEDVEKRFGPSTKKDEKPPFKPNTKKAEQEETDEEEDDALSYFKKLAQED